MADKLILSDSEIQFERWLCHKEVLVYKLCVFKVRGTYSFE